jgi:hypothetical protein
MTILSWILVSLGALMYIEGLCFAGILGLVLKPSKFLWPFLLLLWPIAIPVITYRAYAKYKPVIQEIQQNPFLGAMLGLGQPQANPVAAILGNQASAPAFNPLELLAQLPKPPAGKVSVPVPIPAPTIQPPQVPLEESITETSKEDENNKGDQTQ